MKYVCQVCGYIYDEEREKTPFSNLPDEWKCPLCGAAKSDFAPEQRKGPLKKEEPAPIPLEDDLRELSAGQMAALCSNLAR